MRLPSGTCLAETHNRAIRYNGLLQLLRRNRNRRRNQSRPTSWLRSRLRVIRALQSEDRLMAKLQSDEGAAWGEIKAFFLQHLPEHLDDRDQLAYHLVKKAMDEIFGVQNRAWETFRNPSNVTYIRKKA